MRVKAPGAPGEGPPPIAAVGEAAPAEAAGSASGVAQVSRAARAERASGAELVTQVAERLKAGELTAAEAVEMLIEDIVDRQAGAVLADRQSLAAELKALLKKQTETDPYLASRVRRMGNPK